MKQISLPFTLLLLVCLNVYPFAASEADPLDDLRPGDLLFFWISEKVRHVGIYLGDDRFFHSSTAAGVTISNLNDDYWRYRLITIRRMEHGISLKKFRASFSKYDRARYGYGRTGPDRFDCSGLVWRVFKDNGIEVPRSTRKQMRVGVEVER